MPLKMRKFENDLHAKSYCFEYPVSKESETTTESISNLYSSLVDEDKILVDENIVSFK